MFFCTAHLAHDEEPHADDEEGRRELEKLLAPRSLVTVDHGDEILLLQPQIILRLIIFF